jgi:chemotaxis signal transduction protein
MAKYKGFDIDDEVYSVIRYMDNVTYYHGELQRQQVSWDYLSVMAKLANLDNELTSAKQDFANLTGVLLNQLGVETFNKFANEYAFKAKVAINILIRNLFERTADIGFLATDDEIRDFLKQAPGLADASTHENMRNQLKARFQEYVNKYSIYQDIVLFDKTGQIVARLDDNEPTTHSKAALINQSLKTDQAYIETYGEVDFMVNSHHHLIYSYRVCAENGEALGVISLCFKFEDECTGIFERLLANDEHAMLMLLNENGQVVASSRPNQVPLNAHFNVKQSMHFDLVNYNNCEYVCFLKAADAYQGYSGAGWLGFLMVPVQAVFNQKNIKNTAEFSPQLLAVAQSGDLFNEGTKNISLLANQIQSALDRSVWNGNVYQASEKNGTDAAVSKVLLSEIKGTGTSTKSIFEQSINDIQTTVLSTTLKQCESHASLAMDVIDRSLYERTNDCRWWALNSTFKNLLGQKSLQASDLKAIQSILVSINSLYTVYTNIIVFDKNAQVLAVSNQQYQSLVGTQLKEPWVGATLALQNSEQYAVSDFVETPLYDNQPSYIHAAAIRDPKSIQVVGGIGIVFDAKPQFSALLDDVIPKDLDGNAQKNSFAVYIDASKKILFSNSMRFKMGEILAVESELLDLEKGQSLSKISLIGDYYYAIGCTKSAGYREFNSEKDRYQQQVFALVLIEIGKELPASYASQYAQSDLTSSMYGNRGKTQLATFFVENHWLSLHSSNISSAVPVNQFVPIRKEAGNKKVNPLIAGYMMYKGDSLMVVHTEMLMGAPKPSTKPIQEVVVVKVDGQYVGLSVDRLSEIVDIDSEMIQPISEEANFASNVVRQVVLSKQENAHKSMLKIMDIDLIAAHFRNDLSKLKAA